MVVLIIVSATIAVLVDRAITDLEADAFLREGTMAATLGLIQMLLEFGVAFHGFGLVGWKGE